MTTPNFNSLQVGDEIPSYSTAPVTRTTLALYAGASGDHNPMHIDIDFAKRAGMPDVFAHGMLSMAYLGRLLTNFVPQQAIRHFAVRFTAITHVGDEVTCSGKVVEKYEQGTEKLVRLEIKATNQNGENTLLGEAVIRLP
ncbi:MAG: MaoC family dehydratase [Acidobacteria bacterium]|nr:MaoC family dehydratase [Acidobacteriota bacterium]MDQ3133495.1 MaoC family dehydratase [Acidobacteriota bacterium]